MVSINLDQDKQRFAEWRSQRQGRQLIPDELWQVACNHISTLGITRVAREFRLSDSKLRKKAIEAGIVLPRLGKRKITRQRKTTFQEISLDRMFVPSIATPSLVLGITPFGSSGPICGRISTIGKSSLMPPPLSLLVGHGYRTRRR